MKVITVWEKRGWKFRAKLYSCTGDQLYIARLDFCERALQHNCTYVDAALLDGVFIDGDYELTISEDEYPVPEWVETLVQRNIDIVFDLDSNGLDTVTTTDRQIQRSTPVLVQKKVVKPKPIKGVGQIKLGL